MDSNNNEILLNKSTEVSESDNTQVSFNQNEKAQINTQKINTPEILSEEPTNIVKKESIPESGNILFEEQKIVNRNKILQKFIDGLIPPIISCVLGALAIPFAFFATLHIFSTIAAIIGIIFGEIALYFCKNKLRFLAFFGIGMSIIAILIVFSMVIYQRFIW